MKAIYINLDPYLQAVADWLNAGKPGTAPSFDPLPVAVTIPLGESAVIYIPRDTEGAEASYVVDGNILLSNCNVDTTDGNNVASNIALGFSMFGAPSEEGYSQLYCARAVTADTSITFEIEDFETETITSFTVPVLVRRETASGPVDLVDFTPPAAALTADAINTALGGTGTGQNKPLMGVSLAGAIIHATGDETTSTLYTAGESVSTLEVGDPSELSYALGGSSAS